MKARYWIAGSALAAGAVVLARRAPHPPRTYNLHLPDAGEPLDIELGSVQFIGTATTLIRYRNLTILTDPNFLHRGEQVHIGYGMHSTRLTDPAIEFEDLPPIDFVILSHMHEDHFDKFVQRRLDKHIPILTTPSAARTLRRRGFTRTCPLRTWDKVMVRKGGVSLRVTSMPGTHGPLLVSAMLPEVMGSMLDFTDSSDGGRYRLYISGDTLVFNELREVPKRYPGIDLALVHLGGTRVMGVLVTMDAGQGIEALRILKPDLAIPIHFNDYDVFKSPLEDFQHAVERAGLREKVRYLRHGESYVFTPKGARITAGLQPMV